MSLRNIFSTYTPKYNFLKKAVKDTPFTMLDIGAGNHSPSKTKELFPNCIYYGLDLNKEYSYSDTDINIMTGFYEMDLTKLDFDIIPDKFFDYINIAHVIEHLYNGDVVIEKLSTKLKKGGHIYIEYPGKKSTTLPSMNGSLNFYDDETHVRVYSYNEVASVLEKVGFEILSKGMRRSWFYIAVIPFRALGYLIKGQKLPGNIFWDLLGFAEFVYAKKNT
ncbi:MAG: methyltransferase domain-containing protein [Bacteroidota bacterium]